MHVYICKLSDNMCVFVPNVSMCALVCMWGSWVWSCVCIYVCGPSVIMSVHASTMHVCVQYIYASQDVHRTQWHAHTLLWQMQQLPRSNCDNVLTKGGGRNLPAGVLKWKQNLLNSEKHIIMNKEFFKNNKSRCWSNITAAGEFALYDLPRFDL